jgi:hypothetical protein
MPAPGSAGLFEGLQKGCEPRLRLSGGLNIARQILLASVAYEVTLKFWSPLIL